MGEFRQAGGQYLAHAVDVVGQAGYQVTGAGILNGLGVQLQGGPDQVNAQVAVETHTHFLALEGPGAGQQGPGQHSSTDNRQLCPGVAGQLPGGSPVNELPHHDGGNQGCHGTSYKQQHQQSKLPGGLENGPSQQPPGGLTVGYGKEVSHGPHLLSVVAQPPWWLRPGKSGGCVREGRAGPYGFRAGSR